MKSFVAIPCSPTRTESGRRLMVGVSGPSQWRSLRSRGRAGVTIESAVDSAALFFSKGPQETSKFLAKWHLAATRPTRRIRLGRSSSGPRRCAGGGLRRAKEPGPPRVALGLLAAMRARMSRMWAAKLCTDSGRNTRAPSGESSGPLPVVPGQCHVRRVISASQPKTSVVADTMDVPDPASTNRLASSGSALPQHVFFVKNSGARQAAPALWRASLAAAKCHPQPGVHHKRKISCPRRAR